MVPASGPEPARVISTASGTSYSPGVTTTSPSQRPSSCRGVSAAANTAPKHQQPASRNAAIFFASGLMLPPGLRDWLPKDYGDSGPGLRRREHGAWCGALQG